MYKLTRPFTCAFGVLYPIGSILKMERSGGDVCRFGLSTDPVLTTYTGLNNFLSHTQPL